MKTSVSGRNDNEPTSTDQGESNTHSRNTRLTVQGRASRTADENDTSFQGNIVNSSEGTVTSPVQIDQPSRNSVSIPTLLERRQPNNRIPKSNSYRNVASQDDMEVAYNRVKVELEEAFREKRVHLMSLSQFQQPNKALDKEFFQLHQDKVALEVSIKCSRNGKKDKTPIWSSDNLKGTPIACYQGICLAAAEEAQKDASFITTESYYDESNDGNRKRNWSYSDVLVSSETAKEARVYVKLPDQ